MDYSDHPFEELTLRDKLAIERTLQAAKRTLLAYIGTSLAIFLAGITIWHLLGLVIVSTFFIIISIAMLYAGFYQKKDIEDALAHLMPLEKEED